MAPILKAEIFKEKKWKQIFVCLCLGTTQELIIKMQHGKSNTRQIHRVLWESPNSSSEVQNGFPEMINWFLKDEYEENTSKTYTGMKQCHVWEELQEIQCC